LFLLIIPFGWNVVGKLLALPNEYIAFAARVWHDTPNVFHQGVGLAIFFGETHIALQHKLLIILSFTMPFSFAAVCFWLKQKGRSINNIALATLKIAIVFFTILLMCLIYTYSTHHLL